LLENSFKNKNRCIISKKINTIPYFIELACDLLLSVNNNISKSPSFVSFMNQRGNAT